MNNTNSFKIACIFALSIFYACKKDKIVVEDKQEIVSPTTGTRRQFTLDSIFLYAKQAYLWNDALPSYLEFNPRIKYADYSSELIAFKTELFDISQMKLNPLTDLPFENQLFAGQSKYSYLEIGRGANGTSAVIDPSVNNPVIITTILTVNNMKVGYIALSSFPKLSIAKSYLDAAFNKLATINAKDLIIDLRNNGGGYIETADYIANLIAPSTLNGKVAYVEQFNTQMQQGKALILKHQPYLDENNIPVIYKGRVATMADVDFSETGNTYKFSKKGKVETIKNVYFIVTGSTASASELLINCLKPYLNVKLVGSKTYGKPVGFFSVNVDRYTIYMSGFLIKNATGVSDYFDGMSVDIPVTPDYKYELGNPNEAYLSTTLSYIQTGTISTSDSNRKSHIASNNNLNILPNDTIMMPQAMIENRLRFKTPKK